MLLHISFISGSSKSNSDNFEWFFFDRVSCILLSLIQNHREILKFLKEDFHHTQTITTRRERSDNTLNNKYHKNKEKTSQLMVKQVKETLLM